MQNYLKKQQQKKKKQQTRFLRIPLVIITLFILIDFFIHIDTINMDLPILYLKGSQVEITIF